MAAGLLKAPSLHLTPTLPHSPHLVSNAQGEVVENFLAVLDNFERAKSQIKVETDGEDYGFAWCCHCGLWRQSANSLIHGNKVTNISFLFLEMEMFERWLGGWNNNQWIYEAYLVIRLYPSDLPLDYHRV
ncbi:GrpE nucleotide exchange factor protein [Raphanus sativus]|nr:GrpE nucleotide exchange factor protein [Raphanus sativus]